MNFGLKGGLAPSSDLLHEKGVIKGLLNNTPLSKGKKQAIKSGPNFIEMFMHSKND